MIYLGNTCMDTLHKGDNDDNDDDDDNNNNNSFFFEYKKFYGPNNKVNYCCIVSSG
jgi:hypothetical protein